ncbi:DUF4258 domain-containing protein [Pseudotenacibaculum sp. MALMAid0570]|uniref:DUF4258 domain-containing protein n=1 Tax=Pseudotenacibaculum sp. MALMAid0570 TaxID=3143938 RepID=UPI0032E02E30
MKLLKRVGFYLIGVTFGSIIVLFIWKGKDVAFPYGPDARTLSSIRKKTLLYSENAEKSMKEFEIDSTYIKAILVSGDVSFGKSEPRKKPCAEYYISGTHNEKQVDFYVIRCDSTATIDKVWLKN